MSNPNVESLAQDYAIAAHVPDPAEYFFHDPNMTRLDDSRLIIAAPQWQFLRCCGAGALRIMRSEDHGQTW